LSLLAGLVFERSDLERRFIGTDVDVAIDVEQDRRGGGELGELEECESATLASEADTRRTSGSGPGPRDFESDATAVAEVK